MERFGVTFLVTGVVTFLLGFFLQGVLNPTYQHPRPPETQGWIE